MSFRRMVSMARTPAEKKEAAAEMAAPVADSMPDYPWGMSICLTNEELDKLELDGDCSAGDVIHLVAFAKVTSVSMRDEGGKQDRRVELTITDLAVEDESTEPMEEAVGEGQKMGRYKPMRRGY